VLQQVQANPSTLLPCVVQVVGAVGSGKSSVLGALTGHISKRSGSVAVGGRVAYVAQTAWIMNGKHCQGLTRLSQHACKHSVPVLPVYSTFCPSVHAAWLPTDTVQENILLGSEVEPDRYRMAVKVSQLEPDLKILPK
jgi:ATP-binding cassette subfamily C (CFTR/MRP) protein 1